MVAFDAERYLREIGEQQLLDPNPQQHHRRSPLEDPAAVLIRAGAISVDTAQTVVDDYALAATLRTTQRVFRTARAPGSRPPAHLEARMTVRLDHTLGFGGGQLLLRDLSIGSTTGTMRFRWRRDDARRGSGHVFGGGGQFPWGSAAPTIKDENGNLLTIGSDSGSGNETEWEGKLTVSGQIGPDLSWLEIEGTRVAVDHQITPHEVRVEPLPEKNPVYRWLWRRLAVAEHFHHRDVRLDAAIAALITAGALPADDPELAEIQAVDAQLPAHPHHPHHPPGGASNLRNLPEPWRSLLRRRGKDDGPTMTLLVGAITPLFDGIQAGVHSVSSDSSGFEIEFEISPGLVLVNTALDELPICWWARDDRDNHYLGSPSGWGSSDESASGTMRYWPALDPRARRLELVVSADTRRAIFAVSLDPSEDAVS